MRGAREYASMFETGQYGRLYLASGRHGRGLTFKIYVLPADLRWSECWQDAVEVYGVISGHLGWTEVYGWLHHGPWEKDFEALVATRKAELAESRARIDLARVNEEKEKKKREAELLASYCA